MKNKLLAYTAIVTGLTGSIFAFTQWEKNDKRWVMTPEVQHVYTLQREAYDTELTLEGIWISAKQRDELTTRKKDLEYQMKLWLEDPKITREI